MSWSVEGKTILITGSTSGIGLEAAVALARLGAQPLIVGRRDGRIAAAVADVYSRGGVKARSYRCDFSSQADIRRFASEILRSEPRIDVLVNKAGGAESAPFAKTDPALWRRMIDLNLTSTYLCTRAAAPAMVAAGWGRIVNVTTKLDTMNRIGTHPYGATKAALEMATEVWAKDAAGTGLTINIVNPGAGANTPGMADEMRAMSREGRAPRLVEPDEMVPPLLYVVSDAANGVNGYRFDANAWDASLPIEEAASRAGRPAGFELHPAG